MTAIGAAARLATGPRLHLAALAAPAGRAAVLVATFVCHVAFWLTVWALGPTLFGWQSVALVSGSMSPLLGVGDIVVAEPYDGSALAPGTVVLFHAPGTQKLTTHRIVAVVADGTYRTRGDANAVVDSTPLPASAIVGVGRLRVPFIGLPVSWWQEHQYGPLAGALLVLALATFFRDRGRTRDARCRPAMGRTWRPGRLARIGVALIVAAVVASHLSGAAFAATTTNSSDAWTAASCTPGNAVLSSANGSTVRDTYVNEAAPTTNYGTSTLLSVRAGTTGSRARMLLKFSPLPTIPAGCTFKTATLTVYTSTANSGLTYWIYNVGAAWSDTSVTWNTQPPTSGSPVSVSTASAAGSTAWNVSALVSAQYAGTANNGFLVRDAAEPSTTSLTRYASNQASTASQRPTLTVSWSW